MTTTTMSVEKNWLPVYHEALNTPSVVMWFDECVDSMGNATIPRRTDIVLFVRSDEPLYGLTLEIGDDAWKEVFDLPEPGVPYALNQGKGPIPLISLRFHAVYVRGAKPGSVLQFGCVSLQSESRQALARNNWLVHVGDVPVLFRSGMAWRFTDVTDPPNDVRLLSEFPFKLFAENVINTCKKPVIIDRFMSDADVTRISLEIPDHRPMLVKPSANVAEILDRRIQRWLPGWKRCGSMITAGRYNEGEGIGAHQEGALQGGTLALLVFIKSPEEGGQTVFDTLEIEPVAGRAVTFRMECVHMARDVIKGQKQIIACELTSKWI